MGNICYEGMKILLRDCETGLFLGDGREWTHNPECAQAFSNRFQATAYKLWHRLPRTCAVTAPARNAPPTRARLGRFDAALRLSACAPAQVQAKIELAPGNTLFIRGEGGGLDWRRGQPMAKVDASTWLWRAPGSEPALVVQLLLNDLIWARGDAVILQPPCRLEVVPDFEWPEIPRISTAEDLSVSFPDNPRRTSR